MNNYLASINPKFQTEIISEILQQAEKLKTPIIGDEGINFIIQLLEISKAKNVLEIGSAIGYSAIMMALNTRSKITTIEKNIDNYQLAKENITKAKLESRIKLIHSDALEVELEEEFDVIFIDAAKAQYLKFLEKFKENLSKGGLVICDNLLFHGLVESNESIESKRIKSLVKKIANFNEQLIKHPDFDTYIYEIGDGMSLSIKK